MLPAAGNGHVGYRGITTFQPHNDWHVHRRLQHLAGPRDRGVKVTRLEGICQRICWQILFDPQNHHLFQVIQVYHMVNTVYPTSWICFFGNLLVLLCFQLGKHLVLTNWGAGQSWYRCGESRLPHNLEPRRNLATFTPQRQASLNLSHCKFLRTFHFLQIFNMILIQPVESISKISFSW